MKVTVRIDKSFDESVEFTKEWEMGDLNEFFMDEGDYIDTICKVIETEGRGEDATTVTYTVTIGG